MSRASRSAALAATITLALAVLVLAGCARLQEKPAADPRMEVRMLLDTYVEALNRSDSTGVMSAYAPDSQATLAGREHFFHGPGAISRTAGEGPLPMGQNTYSVD